MSGSPPRGDQLPIPSQLRGFLPLVAKVSQRRCSRPTAEIATRPAEATTRVHSRSGDILRRHLVPGCCTVRQVPDTTVIRDLYHSTRDTSLSRVHQVQASTGEVLRAHG